MNRLFGSLWRAIIPTTRPRLSKEDIKWCKDSRGIYKKSFTYPLWHTTIGIYDNTRKNAAIIIQKHFRSWQVRMRNTFNPNTKIGAYYALKEFNKLVLML